MVCLYSQETSVSNGKKPGAQEDSQLCQKSMDNLWPLSVVQRCQEARDKAAAASSKKALEWEKGHYWESHSMKFGQIRDPFAVGSPIEDGWFTS